MSFMMRITVLLLLFSINTLSAAKNIQCDYEIVESIPEGVVFPPESVSKPTFDAFLSIIENAKSTLDIASFYWTLLCEDVVKKPVGGCEEGSKILQAIISASKVRNVNVRIAVNYERKANVSKDILLLQKAGVDVRFLNFKKLVGAGILHTKFMVADNSSIYIGSANMDWRALTQVKELGVHLPKCNQVAQDLGKIFEVYWYLGYNSSVVPKQWPSFLSTKINKETPLELNLGNQATKLYISSSPKQFNPNGRTNDIEAILDVIRSAKKYINIAVMDYSPIFEFSYPERYWPVIDDELKRAAIERKVIVRLLASSWRHTSHNMYVYLRSLDVYYRLKYSGRIEVKLFVVPPLPHTDIPFSRVNHNKYMVTDKHAYIGTSNWSADYFINTGGVAFVAECGNNQTYDKYNSDIRTKLQRIFERDWYSNYTKFIPNKID